VRFRNKRSASCSQYQRIESMDNAITVQNCIFEVLIVSIETQFSW
jgi:hypothetical protein